MSPKTQFALLSALALAFGALPAAAQSDIQWDNGRPVIGTGVFSPREVESLVAPIALFPDNLVAQIMMAATYPYDVEDAADWVSDPRNARLVGYQLADALDEMDWDPSVKALTSAPDVLRMMDERRDWTRRLGEAFMADQGMVMDAVQHLRHQARAAGRLYPDRYRRVIDRDGLIIIEPVSPSEMYVEFYDPTIAFGAWAYPDYPPYYFPRVYYDIVRPIPIITPLWGWSSWDWRGRNLRLDVGRWQRLNHNRPHRFNGNTWRHDPGRNQGRQFRGGMNRTNFGRPDFSRDFNGRDGRFNQRDNNRDNDRTNDRRPRGNQPSANANPNPNPAFHGRGPGLNQDSNQRWTGGRDRGGRQQANTNPGVNPSAAPPPTVIPDANRDRGRQFNGFNRPDRGGDRDGGRQRRQEANVNPVPQAIPAPQATPQPDQNRFGRGGDRGEGRGWQRREQANAGGEFRGRGRGGQPAPQAAPQPQQQRPQEQQAQPQNNNDNGKQRRFHGRGRGDDPAS